MATGQHPEEIQTRSVMWRDRLLMVRQVEATAQAKLNAKALREARQRKGRHNT